MLHTLDLQYPIAEDGIDPALVPKRTLYTGAKMPAIGLGTFGSDHVSAGEIAEAVGGAVSVGYRHLDCASVYSNEAQIGATLNQVFRAGLRRDELWIVSKLWNDKHAEEDVISSCRKSIADLGCNYLDMYLVHWPFPNFHPPGCSVESRSPNARPYLHENFMKTWRRMERLVDLGLVRHIGTSNMTIPKLKLLLADARIKPAVNEMELHPHFQQPELFEFVRANGIEPVGYSPIGSPGRPERDRTSEDTVDIEDPGDRVDCEAPGSASRGGLHQVGGPARPDAHSAVDQPAQLPGELARHGNGAADRRRDAGDRRHRPQLPADQRAGLSVEAGAGVGGSLGCERRDC